MNSTDIEYVLHCIKNASELINQSESEKAKGLLLSAELLLSEKLTSDNSDYAKLKGAIESIADYGGCLTGEDAQEMKQIAIKALQQLCIVAERCTKCLS